MASVTKGTCGACFRAMRLTKDGLVVRHGWSEFGGTRRVGEYGNVAHSGPCFGVGWAPYEVSPECTRAFLTQVLFPMGLNANAYLQRLGTRPEFKYDGKTFLANEAHVRGIPRDGGWDSYGRWQVLLRDGDPASCLMKWSTYTNDLYRDTSARIPSYDDHLGNLVRQAEASWNSIARDSLYCDQMIREWKPAEVKEVEKKVALVHTPSPKRRWTPMCRWSLGRSVNFQLTDDPTKVTCPKCQGYLAAQAKKET